MTPRPPPLTLGFELTRQVTLRSVHQLKLESLDAEANLALYGKCFRPHGHDYRVQVTVEAPLNARSGLIFDRANFDEILEKALVQVFDGADLNAHFANTSGESLAYEFYKILEPHFAPGLLKRVVVRETPKNFFEYAP